jgi:hypothetical protein
MAELDLTSVSNMDYFLTSRPRAWFKTETIIKAMELGNVDVVALLIQRNTELDKPITQNLLEYAINHRLSPQMVGMLIVYFGNFEVRNLIPICGNDLGGYLHGAGLQQSEFPPLLLQAVSDGAYPLEDGIKAIKSYKRFIALHSA